MPSRIRPLPGLIVALIASSGLTAQMQENTITSPEADPSATLRAEIVELLDHTAFISAESGFPTALLEEIETARSNALQASPDAFAEMEPYIGDMIRHLRGSAATHVDAILDGEFHLHTNAGKMNKRAALSPLSLPPDSTRPFPGRDHFDLDWSFETSTPEGEPSGSTDSTQENGTCRSPGPSNRTLIDTKRDEIISFSVKVVAERFCEQSVLGINLSVACIPTDIVYYAFHAISESQQMCSSLMGRTYVDAIFDGADYLHERIGGIDDDVKREIRNAASATISKINLSQNRIINQRLVELRNSTTTSIEQSGDAVGTAITETEDRLGARIDALNSNVTTASNQGTDELLTLVDVRSDAVDSALADTGAFIDVFEQENRRLMIEANLAQQSRPVAAFKTIASFRQPERIPEVAEIVRQTIDRLTAAGESVNNAESLYFMASSLLAAGDYQGAYKLLGQSYQAAVR